MFRYSRKLATRPKTANLKAPCLHYPPRLLAAGLELLVELQYQFTATWPLPRESETPASSALSSGCFGPYWRILSVQNPPVIAAFVQTLGVCEYPAAPYWDKGLVFVCWRLSKDLA